MSLDAARSVADAVLYEGYLLYPYRATSSKNQMRWQFGVLGPPAAWGSGVGEEPTMRAELVVRDLSPTSRVGLHLRFLQLQARGTDQVDAADPSAFRSTDALVVGSTTLLPWDEAVEQDVALGPFDLSSLRSEISIPVRIAGSEEVEIVTSPGGTIAGRIVRRCWPLAAEVRLQGETINGHPGVLRLSVNVENTSPAPATDRDEAVRHSFLGAHLLLEATDAAFVSLLEPPPELAAAAAACQNRRCWPVLTGTEGDTDTVLVSPIILYDYPAVAPESAGALFDSTEIDEILTLRVLALTDEEKAVARATDPAAAAIIDRCERMSPEAMQQLHGVLRHPHLGGGDPSPFDAIPTFTTPTSTTPTTGPVPDSSGAPWWDPGVDGAVSPSHDSVTVAGVAVAKGSRVRLRPSRRADAQDLFFAGQVATVSAVYFDVDGETHVAVVLVDDPAADLHEWYGRYLYFSPDEIEPLDGPDPTSTGGDQPWHS